MKNIDIKTEPAGYISFGELTPEQAQILSDSLEAQEIADELLEIRYNTDGSLEECEGVFISGLEGEQGNEGIIAVDEFAPKYYEKQESRLEQASGSPHSSSPL